MATYYEFKKNILVKFSVVEILRKMKMILM